MRLPLTRPVSIDERANGNGYVTVEILDLARICRTAYTAYDDLRTEMETNAKGIASSEVEFFTRHFADLADQALKLAVVLEATKSVIALDENANTYFTGFADALEFTICSKCALGYTHDCDN